MKETHKNLINPYIFFDYSPPEGDSASHDEAPKQPLLAINMQRHH